MKIFFTIALVFSGIINAHLYHKQAKISHNFEKLKVEVSGCILSVNTYYSIHPNMMSAELKRFDICSIAPTYRGCECFKLGFKEIIK